jgi:hypothetical protein
MSQFEPAAMAKRASNPNRANVSQLNGHATDIGHGASAPVIEVKPQSRVAEFKAKLAELVKTYADVAGMQETSHEFWRVWVKDEGDQIPDHESEQTKAVH